MDERSERLAVLAGIGAVAALLAAVPVVDLVRDLTVQDEPVVATVLENSVPLFFVAVVGWWEYRLLTDERFFGYERSIATRFATGVALTAVAIGWILWTQSLQSQYYPRVIFANATAIGALGGLALGAYDVRRRRHADRLEAERNRFGALFENASDAIIEVELVDGTPRIAAVNEVFEEVFGYDAAEALDRSVLDIHVPAAEREEATTIVDRTTDGERLEREVTRETADGDREFLLRTVPIDSGDAVTRFYKLYTDITDRKRREQRLEELTEELSETVQSLERSNEELEQFAYVASHDLQEPMRMVSSYMDLLEAEYRDELDETAREYIDFAADGATRMQRMIDDLLTYSRVGEQNLDRETVDADEVLDDVLADLQIAIEEHDATVTADDLPTLSADPGQLARVFQNLIANALEYVEASPEIHVGVDARDDEYVFSVEDNGPGIPVDQQDRIFELFTRGERNDEDDGTGIGLTLCKRIVEGHGGEIWVESEPGDGSTFLFTIPR